MTDPLTDTDPIVTRKHRELALVAVWGDGFASMAPGWVQRWLETGTTSPDPGKLARVALALARLEAQTAWRCWDEGNADGFDGKNRNPYTQIDEVDDG